MKRTAIYVIIAVAAANIIFASCRKHEYYQENPNSPSVATPSLLLSNVCQQTFAVWPMDAAYASRHMTYYERPNVYVNYNWGAGSFEAYDILRQVQDMHRLATTAEHKNFQGIALFFRAYHFARLTETFGDVPYRDALKALEDNPRPAYDRQEDIYKGILQELDEANSLLNEQNGEILGDIIYGGEVMKWKKLINAFRLRLLIHLSKKAEDAALNVKGQFDMIVSDPGTYPLMESIGDNAEIVYNTTAVENYYPLYQNNSVPSLAALEQGFVKLLKDRNDVRLFHIAEPVTNQPANVFASYEGVDAGLNISDQNNASPGASKIARRYINDQVNEPMMLLSYAEQEFLIAEGISRGWTSGDAAAHYYEGVSASMQFYDIPQAQIDTYLEQPEVIFNPADAIELILTQKYISFFLNSGWEPFFEYLRTGVPELSTGPGTQNGGNVPKRFLYPQTEFSYNEENVNEALQRQYNGNDNINGTMWVLQD